MSVTSIAITQDNVVSGCNLLAAHSPLIFLIEATGSDFPDYLTVNIKEGTITLDTFKAVAYQWVAGGQIYIFNAERILRAFMPSFDDQSQADDTIARCKYSDRALTIEVTHEALTDSVDIIPYVAARQRGEVEALAGIYDNDAEKVYCFKDRYFYLHYYQQAAASIILAFDSLTDAIEDAGLYRAKIKKTSLGITTVEAGEETAEDKTITVECLPNCSTGLYVKFLDSTNGYYKHWLFNSHYGLESTTEDIGNIYASGTNLLSPYRKDIGKRFGKRYLITADNLSSEMLEYLNPIGTTPRLYVEINGQWVLCRIAQGNVPNRWRKGNAGSYSLIIEISDQYTVTML
jgi:hypothetical protein